MAGNLQVSTSFYARNKSIVSKHAYNRRIALDFDGTVVATTATYDKVGKELQGAREFVQKLREEGFYIVLWTQRTYAMTKDELSQAPTEYPKLMMDMIDWLEKTDFPYDEIWMGSHKPPCFAFIDDRAFSFVESNALACWESIHDAIVEQKS